MTAVHDCVVIGGGVSGVSAAARVSAAGKSCLILEAENRLGGRTRTAKLAGVDVDVGAYFIHGSDCSQMMDLVRTMGWEYTILEWPDYFYVHGKLVRAEDDADLSEALRIMHDLPELLHDAAAAEGDKSLLSFFQEKNLSPAVMQAIDACFANDYGTSLNHLGLKAVAQELDEWSSGEDYVVLDRPLTCIVDALIKFSSGITVRTNSPVVSVTRDASSLIKIGLKPQGNSSDGDSDPIIITCKSVIVAVPLSCLQQQHIRFDPPLSAAKLDSVTKVRQDAALKIMVAFRERFWEEAMFDVVVPNAFVPEFWFGRTKEGQWWCCGFTAGDAAAKLGEIPKQDAIHQFLALLDEIFRKEGDEKPASSRVVDSLVFDWQREVEFVRGGYSCPALGSCKEDRIRLSEPEHGNIFFCGEATHHAQNSCVHGAMETGDRAGSEAISYLTTNSKRDTSIFA